MTLSPRDLWTGHVVKAAAAAMLASTPLKKLTRMGFAASPDCSMPACAMKKTLTHHKIWNVCYIVASSRLCLVGIGTIIIIVVQPLSRAKCDVGGGCASFLDRHPDLGQEGMLAHGVFRTGNCGIAQDPIINPGQLRFLLHGELPDSLLSTFRGLSYPFPAEGTNITTHALCAKQSLTELIEFSWSQSTLYTKQAKRGIQDCIANPSLF